MTTVLISGVGALGGWALELLAREPAVERIVTIKRSPWDGPSRATLAMLGSTIQGYGVHFEHHRADLMDVDSTAALLAEIRPDGIVHSATVQSPRALMHAEVDPGVRAVLRTATFGMWLPWHLLPAARLVEAIQTAGIDPVVVNASFPDVVNPALWRHFGGGPRAGAGNVEVCAARIERYVMETTGKPAASIDVRLVGSHALLSHGTSVPHHLAILIDGDDRTDDFDLEEILGRWPEPIDWKQVDVFSLYAASAVKNLLGLLGARPIETHVTSPDGMPGGYPASLNAGRIDLRLPDSIDLDAAIATNEQAARRDAIERIETDGTVVYTAEAAAAMAELGYAHDAVRFDTLEEQVRQLRRLFAELVSQEEHENA